MNMRTTSVLLAFLSPAILFAQGTMTVTTDKSSYQYGETIAVRLTVANNGDSSFTIVGSSSCTFRINLQGVQTKLVCTADERDFVFAPGTSMTWVWHLHPDILGYPVKDGVQTIYGVGGGYLDSVTFTGPKFYGGLLDVSYNLTQPDSSIQSLRDSIGATVTNSRTLASLGIVEETWSITGHLIDSILAVYSSDSRLRYIEPQRYLMPDQFIQTTVPGKPNPPEGYSLSQNYPNPFNPTTNIVFTIPTRQYIQIRVSDVSGRTVARLADGDFQPGTHRIVFDATSLPSGTYFYRLVTPMYEQTKKIMLLK